MRRPYAVANELLTRLPERLHEASYNDYHSILDCLHSIVEGFVVIHQLATGAI